MKGGFLKVSVFGKWGFSAMEMALVLVLVLWFLVVVFWFRTTFGYGFVFWWRRSC
jgi:hypothetical protein